MTSEKISRFLHTKEHARCLDDANDRQGLLESLVRNFGLTGSQITLTRRVLESHMHLCTDNDVEVNTLSVALSEALK